MTDAELIKTAADMAMGWVLQPREFAMLQTMDTGQYRINPEIDAIFTPRGWWNPLTSDIDSFSLVDALTARGLRFLLEYRQPLRGGPPEWVVRFGEGELASSRDRRRAIVVAALKACEVAVEV